MSLTLSQIIVLEEKAVEQGVSVLCANKVSLYKCQYNTWLLAEIYPSVNYLFIAPIIPNPQPPIIRFLMQKIGHIYSPVSSSEKHLEKEEF